MKRLICYGDSNTWGYRPVTADRYPADIRWPGVLASELKEEWTVIESGVNGRFAQNLAPGEPDKNGLASLPGVLSAQAPLEMVLLFLGINDVFEPNMSVVSIAKAAEELGREAEKAEYGRRGAPPYVILMGPPPVNPVFARRAASEMEEEKAWALNRAYRDLAQRTCWYFFNTAARIEGCKEDGIHLTEESHIRLGRAMAAFLREESLVPAGC